MDKFDDLTYFLKHQSRDHFTLSFTEIEKILGFELCDSAYKYKVYWNPSGRKGGLPTAVLECGYKMEPDLVNKRVTFHKI